MWKTILFLLIVGIVLCFLCWGCIEEQMVDDNTAQTGCLTVTEDWVLGGCK